MFHVWVHNLFHEAVLDEVAEVRVDKVWWEQVQPVKVVQLLRSVALMFGGHPQESDQW